MEIYERHPYLKEMVDEELEYMRRQSRRQPEIRPKPEKSKKKKRSRKRR